MELSAFGKAAILLPIPGTAQEANAKLLAAHEAAIVLDQRTATANDLVTAVRRILANADATKAMQERISTMAEDGLPIMAKTISHLTSDDVA